MGDSTQLRWTDDIKAFLPITLRAIGRTWWVLALIVGVELLNRAVFRHAHGLGIAVATMESVISVPIMLELIKETFVRYDNISQFGDRRLTGAIFWRLSVLQLIAAFVQVLLILPVMIIAMPFFTHQQSLLMGIVVFFGFALFAVMSPLLWWLPKACLSTILVFVEPIGVFASLQKSHQLLNGHFWQTVRYLAVPCILTYVASIPSFLAFHFVELTEPTLSLNYGMKVCANALTASFSWIVCFWTSYPFLVRLYAYVTANEVSQPLSEVNKTTDARESQ